MGTLYQQLAEKVEEQGHALSTHVDQVAAELAKHQEALRLRSEEEETRYDKLRCLIEKQADTASKNQEQLGCLIEETRDVVQLYKDLQSVSRVGVGIQKFALWVLKWPLIGTGMYAAVTWSKKFGEAQGWW